MKCYLLLRNNVETGPFTVAELVEQQLKPTDLIWIEGQSTVWKYPAELDALKPLVADVFAAKAPQTGQVIHTSKGIFVALPPQPNEDTVTETGASETAAEPETRFSQPLETLRETYEQHTTFRFHKSFSKSYNVLWIGCVFAGLLFSAALIKDIVETYDQNSAGLTAAALPANDVNNLREAPEESPFQNALTTEVVPVDTVTMKAVKHIAPKVNLRKLVQLQANDYRVGLLGGIKNLRMLVVNKSGYILDKVKFELQYLKPNGDVLKTEQLTVKGISPKSSKGLPVAGNSRGVKIAYHITDIQSRQNSDALVNL